MYIIKRFNYIKVCDKKYVKVNDLSNGQNSVNKNITCKTPALRTDLCDYSAAHIVVNGTVTVALMQIIKQIKS